MDSFKEKNLPIFFLSIVFGISSWVVFSGVWVEAPLLLKKLPESWKIPSMIGAVSQLAQLGPILLFLMKCKCVSCFKSNRARSMRAYAVSDRVIIYGLFACGLTAGACLALFWDQTAFIFGQSRSVAFFVCVFFLAILDCTCTIVFLTYIGSFKGNYITALYIGEGISSLLPSFFALLQGTGDHPADCSVSNNGTNNLGTNATLTEPIQIINPRFSVSAYFWLLFSTLVISFGAFLALEFWPSFKNEKIKPNERTKKQQKSVQLEEEESINFLSGGKKKVKHSSVEMGLLLTGITIVSFTLYGFIPGLSSYSALPYGHDIMHLSVTLALITQPFSSLIATFFQIRSTKIILFALGVAVLISSYILVLSCLSPCPPLKNHWIGGSIVISCWVCSFALLMYLRCCITSKLKKNHGQKSLVWCGLLSQLGQFIGSIFIYILVDQVALFKEIDECNPQLCL